MNNEQSAVSEQCKRVALKFLDWFISSEDEPYEEILKVKGSDTMGKLYDAWLVKCYNPDKIESAAGSQVSANPDQLIKNLTLQREDIINSMQLEIDRLNKKLELLELTKLSNEELQEKANEIRKRLGI